jgi:hypothetical protein
LRIRRRTAVAVLCLVAFVACGEDDETNNGTSEPAAQPDENRVSIGLTEYAYDMPAQVTGGAVTLEFNNEGELPHEAAFGAVSGDHDAEDAVQALESGKNPNWMQDLAGVPVLDSGATASMTRDLDPGSYVFFCYLPVPGSGAPHVNEGMFKVFEVKGTSEAEGPQPDLTITATDDGFEVPDIPAGAQTIELVNDGKKSHEFLVYSLEPGKTEKDIDKWFGSGMKGAKPALFPGGLQSIEPGTSVVVEMTFEAGRSYILQDFSNKLEEEFEVQ